jgi:hypothetical protein
MNYLVACPCGHALDRHDDAGCRGGNGDPCACRNDAGFALDAAIAEARQNPWARAAQPAAEVAG